MAAGRLLKGSISSDRRVAQLTYPAMILYAFSIPHLDVDGRILGLPAHVRGTVAPELSHRRPSDWTDQKVAAYMLEWTTTLDDLGQLDPLVLWYATKNVSVCAFRGFDKNQRLRRDREAPSRLPAPPPELLEQPAMATAGMAFVDDIRESSGREVEVEVKGFDLQAAVVQDPARARETQPTALHVSQLQEQISSRAAELTHGFGERVAGQQSLPVHDLELLAAALAGADERTLLTLRKYARRGCGEREFAVAAESLQRRRLQPGRPLDSEVRYFASELARLLGEREGAVA